MEAVLKNMNVIMYFYIPIRVIPSSCMTVCNFMEILQEIDDRWGKIINKAIDMLLNMRLLFCLIWRKSENSSNVIMIK